jgi:probable rRNA maturation factor
VNLSLSRSDDAPLDWLDDAVVRTLEKICRPLEPLEATVNVVVVDDSYIRDINARFRDKDTPTDVISFSYLDDIAPGLPEGHDDLAGEIYISHDTVEKEAARAEVGAAHMFLRVGVHGLLHVLGYEHEADDEAALMEGRERDILSAHLGRECADALF